MSVVGLVVAIAGCDRSHAARDSGTASPAAPAVAGATPDAARASHLAGWNDTLAGPDLLVSGSEHLGGRGGAATVHRQYVGQCARQ